jgi:hypothetical protein
VQSVLIVDNLKYVDYVGLEDHARHDDLVQYVVHLEGTEEGREGESRRR